MGQLEIIMPPLTAYFLGLTDGDLFTPSEHASGKVHGTDRAILTLADVSHRLRAAELPRSLTNIREYLTGFGEHGRFLVAAAKMGAVDHATGHITA